MTRADGAFYTGHAPGRPPGGSLAGNGIGIRWRRGMGRKNWQRGFTLIEVVLASAATAAVLGAISWALSAGR
jgi:prepilin-type N-terminal cleavage/methylation domain-containing protein